MCVYSIGAYIHLPVVDLCQRIQILRGKSVSCLCRLISQEHSHTAKQLYVIVSKIDEGVLTEIWRILTTFIVMFQAVNYGHVTQIQSLYDIVFFYVSTICLDSPSAYIRGFSFCCCFRVMFTYCGTLWVLWSSLRLYLRFFLLMFFLLLLSAASMKGLHNRSSLLVLCIFPCYANHLHLSSPYPLISSLAFLFSSCLVTPFSASFSQYNQHFSFTHVQTISILTLSRCLQTVLSCISYTHS